MIFACYSWVESNQFIQRSLGIMNWIESIYWKSFDLWVKSIIHFDMNHMKAILNRFRKIWISYRKIWISYWLPGHSRCSRVVAERRAGRPELCQSSRSGGEGSESRAPAEPNAAICESLYPGRKHTYHYQSMGSSLNNRVITKYQF